MLVEDYVRRLTQAAIEKRPFALVQIGEGGKWLRDIGDCFKILISNLYNFNNYNKDCKQFDKIPYKE